jgi:hypothetical protein
LLYWVFMDHVKILDHVKIGSCQNSVDFTENQA